MRDGEWSIGGGGGGADDEEDLLRQRLIERFRMARHRGIGVLTEKDSNFPAETKLFRHYNLAFLCQILSHASEAIWKVSFEQSNILMLLTTVRGRFIGTYSDVDKERQRQRNMDKDSALAQLDDLSPGRASKMKEVMLNQTACDADLMNSTLATMQIVNSLFFSHHQQFVWEENFIDGVSEVRFTRFLPKSSSPHLLHLHASFHVTPRRCISDVSLAVSLTYLMSDSMLCTLV